MRLFDVDRTHGHWPWGAAALAPPATALAWRERRRLAREGSWVWWLPLPALLWHQTEEWFWPGGFLPWFNREVLGSDRDEFPIDRRVGIGVNVGLGWGGGLLAALAGRRAPALAAWVAAMNVGNAVVHVGAFARERRYRPGLATATFLLAPLGAGGLVALRRDEEVPRAAVAAGAAVGALMSVAGFTALRRRARSRPR